MLSRRRNQGLESTQQSQYWLGHLESLQRGSGRLHITRADDSTPDLFIGRAEETKTTCHNCLHKHPQAGFVPARPGRAVQVAELAGTHNRAVRAAAVSRAAPGAPPPLDRVWGPLGVRQKETFLLPRQLRSMKEAISHHTVQALGSSRDPQGTQGAPATTQP